MLLLHLDTAGEEPVFRGEMPRDGGDAFDRVPAGALLERVRPCVWYPDQLVAADAFALAPSSANLLMFLSDVRGAKFREGVTLAPDVRTAVRTFREAADLVAAGRFLPDLVERADGTFRACWRALDEPGRERPPFFHWCVDRLARRAGRGTLERVADRPESVHDAWLAALRADDGAVAWPVRDDLVDLVRTLAAWRAPLAVDGKERAALVFTLVPPADENGDWRIDHPRPATRLGLVALGQAARIFPALRYSPWTRADAESFLRKGAADLAAAGFATVVPESMRGEFVSAAADLVPVHDDPSAAALPSGAVNAKLTIRVAGETVGEDELRFLVDQGSSLVYFRDRWIEVDVFVLREALRALESANGRKIKRGDAIALACGLKRFGRLRVDDVRAHGWLRGLVNELRGDARFRALPAPEGLAGELRDYQRRGFSWLCFMAHWGFGALLADDMGLGKTVQTIAFLLQRRAQDAKGTALVVAPVSVVTNWVREINRFAPSLKVMLHQGEGRAAGGGFSTACRAADVVVTGYSLLVHDFRDFSAVAFSALVLDEAQMVKNPDTRVAKAVRGLDVSVRVALTGTPIENSPLDLWSVQEFLNPGLLGERREFETGFVRPIREDPRSGAAARLRRAIEPFLLRRLKTEPGIAAELGAKRIVREYCALSPAQRRQYEEALDAYRRDRDASAATSRGRMLALLTELKLVCDGEGKFARLDALLEQIFAAGESALVFSQYARVGRQIRAHLLETTGRSFPFLHGALTSRQREAEIAAFNADPEPNAFILSLKAGGFGLNLTRATHVIHFDRWWNPAVEAQATDRAHRIGQKNTVFVHDFICAGTLEDRIDQMLETKKALADEIVVTGESFLLAMSAEEFDRTVSLTS